MAKLIVALDFDNPKDALNMASTLKGTVEWVKVGLELFITEGPSIIEKLKAMDYKVFVDLKLHDIPNTVKGATLALASHKADMLTLHISGTENMVKEAVSAMQNSNHKALLFGVTVLTSISEGEYIGYDGNLKDLTNLLAKKASMWGLDGIVCSGHEVEGIKKDNPNLLGLCPGIRLSTGEVNDQKRVMTPMQAVQNGADFLVVGRPITQAENPLAIAKEVLAEIAKAKK